MFNTYIHKRQMNQKLLTVISTCLLLPSILQIKIGLLLTFVDTINMDSTDALKVKLYKQKRLFQLFHCELFITNISITPA